MTINNSLLSFLAAGIGLLCSAQVYAKDNVTTKTVVPKQVVSDEGIEAVRVAQEASPAPVGKKFKNANALLREQLKANNWKQGWDKKKQRIIVIENAEFKTDNPTKDKDFFIKREQAVKKAYLTAKVDIISTINQEMSAIDIVSMPGSDINKKLGAERDQLDKEIAKEKEELAQLLEKTNKAEADMLRGTTFGERLNDMMVALIKKLDAEYDKNEWDEAKRARFEELKKQLELSTKRYSDLQGKADAMQASVRERQESAVETMASMPLYGSSIIMQTESLNDKNGFYQVAVMFCWSMAMERAARAIVTGEEFKIKPSANAMSIDDWLETQNLATMIGPRQYLDAEGNRWFLGISARPYDDNLTPTQRRDNVRLSKQYAEQMAAFCLWADVEGYKMAKTVIESRGDEKSQKDIVAETYSERLTQLFRNKHIPGIEQKFDGELEHPITGTTVYVTVYGISSDSAKELLEIEKANYATKVMDNRHQAEERGRDAANKEAAKESENRAEDFQKGYNKQEQTLNGELQKRQPVINNAEVPSSNGKENPKKDKEAKSGVFGGDANVKDDF